MSQNSMPCSLKEAVPREELRRPCPLVMIFLLVLGVAFIWFGIHNFGAHGVNWLFVAFGVLFLSYGISQFYTANKFRNKMRGGKG